MVDNTTLNPGTGGDTIALDDIGGVKFQRVKLIHGADGVNAGDISTANPFPVVAKTDEMNVDIHGQGFSVSRVVQVTAKFFQQAPDQFLSISASGGATATGPTAGLGVFASGTATTAALLAQTPTSIMYATQFEAWASMAGVFTAPTSAASFQRLGIYNAVNGYFFGYSGLTFGVTIRVNSVDTFVAKTAWNVDTLIGDAASKFSANNVPAALNPNNMNMYRIRYGWYGAATARFEVYSPDGDWVLVHQVRTANVQTGANITNPDLPMAVEVSKTASDATNLIISCGGWGAGITAPASGTTLSGQGSIAALNAAVSVPITGVGALSFSVTGAWVATLSFQYSLDGLTWTADTPLNNVTGSFASSTTVNGAFTAPVGSYKFYRIIATAFTSGSASVVYNASPKSNVVVAQSLITDGAGGTPATVKPASTAAVFSDPALTVAVRPGGALVTASAALADAVTNPTIGLQAALLSMFNGTTWDRVRGTIANGLAVDVTRLPATPTGANTIGAVTGPAAAPLALDGTLTNHTQKLQSTTLAVTVTAAANTAATATLPAVAAQFHYITGIEIMRTSTALLAGTATLVVTTSNLPGALAWSFGNAMAAGATQRDLFITFPNPIKSSVVNTATTVVLPAPGAAVLWRANVYYYTAA